MHVCNLHAYTYPPCVSSAPVQIATVRGTNFEPAAESGGSAGDAEVMEEAGAQTMSSFVSHALAKSDRPSLQAANRVVAGGRGMKEGANFEMLNVMADKLGAAVGASRAAVDAGFVPNEYQVGQTGKIVAPVGQAPLRCIRHRFWRGGHLRPSNLVVCVLRVLVRNSIPNGRQRQCVS